MDGLFEEKEDDDAGADEGGEVEEVHDKDEVDEDGDVGGELELEAVEELRCSWDDFGNEVFSQFPLRKINTLYLQKSHSNRHVNGKFGENFKLFNCLLT